MKLFFQLALLLLFSQYNPSGPVFPTTGGGGCVPGVGGLTYDWRIFAAGTTVATNGSGVNNWEEILLSNNASQATGGNQPIYTTGAINSLPAALFNGTSDTLTLTGASTPTSGPIPLGTALQYGFAVFRLSSTGNNSGILGGATSGGGLEWRINSSNHQELLAEGVASIGVGSATFAASTTYAVAYSYNQTTGAYAFYTIAGGTVSSDGSGTNVQIFTDNTDSLGAAPDVGDYFHGYIPEIGFIIGSTTTPTNLGTYIQSCFAH